MSHTTIASGFRRNWGSTYKRSGAVTLKAHTVWDAFLRWLTPRHPHTTPESINKEVDHGVEGAGAYVGIRLYVCHNPTTSPPPHRHSVTQPGRDPPQLDPVPPPSPPPSNGDGRSVMGRPAPPPVRPLASPVRPPAASASASRGRCRLRWIEVPVLSLGLAVGRQGVCLRGRTEWRRSATDRGQGHRGRGRWPRAGRVPRQPSPSAAPTAHAHRAAERSRVRADARSRGP